MTKGAEQATEVDVRNDAQRREERGDFDASDEQDGERNSAECSAGCKYYSVASANKPY